MPFMTSVFSCVKIEKFVDKIISIILGRLNLPFY